MRMILSAAIAIALSASGAAQAPATTELEGTWDAVWSQLQDKPPMKLGEGEVAFVTLVFRGGELTATHLLPNWTPNPNPVTLAFTLNTQTSPKQIDYWQPWESGKPPVQFGPTNKILAVYELAGDELRLELPVCEDTGPRPTEIAGKARCSILLVLKRRQPQGMSSGLKLEVRS